MLSPSVPDTGNADALNLPDAQRVQQLLVDGCVIEVGNAAPDELAVRLAR